MERTGTTRPRRADRWIVVQLLAVVVDAPAVRCPRCGEDRLTEFDPAIRKNVCDVCSMQWTDAAGVFATPDAPGRPPDDEQPAGRG
jgi:hypothetical protein